MKDLPKAYDPKEIEEKLLDFWENNNFFKANPNSSKPAYCIILPPPNVTGSLHMGHALGDTLQDTLIRWKRMSGFEALWIPGTDHAGIATQTVVERHLIKTLGKTRKEFDKDEFLQHVWEWKEKNEGRILSQLRRIGASVDWSRKRFTMDSQSNQAVRTMFKKLYEEGLIYRGNYLVNWDPVTQTALADDEVEYEERDSFLWHIRYPYKDGSGHALIATTRPETMLGDTAIAVAPNDKRYADKIGSHLLLPLMNRELPIIEDFHVDPEFGTGMVKITPAHDPNDYQIGLRHQIKMINIMTPDGKINENGGQFEGLSVKNARKAVVEELQKLGLIEKIEPHTYRVGISYRSKATIEPYLSKQWFVKMEGFAEDLKEMVDSNSVKLLPKNWDSTYFHWINNLRDWCISRQLWWGHRIPIWYNKSDPSQIICYEGEGLPEEVEKKPHEWEQDPDVLDTWFSSALWPFSVLGWPDKTEHLEKFYPNSVLVTGFDILFFWIARMLCMGKYTLDTPPFPETFIHGLIYGKSYWREKPEGGICYVKDEERIEYDLGKPVPSDVISRWEKMSKSKGNIIDPLEILEVYGTDAMRMALCSSGAQAREIDLDRRKFEEFKNFTNKVWNGARFIFMNLAGDPEKNQSALTKEELEQGLALGALRMEDLWILSALNTTIKSVNTALKSYSFDNAAQGAYEFYWKKFCAYYVEIVKPALYGKTTEEDRKTKQKILLIVLCASLRLMHPMAPFITENLFLKLKEGFQDLRLQKEVDPITKETIDALNSTACTVAPYPQPYQLKLLEDSSIEEGFTLVENVVYAIRNLRGEMKVSPSVAVDVWIAYQKGTKEHSLIDQLKELIPSLVKVKELYLCTQLPEDRFGSNASVESLHIFIPLPTELKQQELKRLEKEKTKTTLSVERIETKLSNENFLSRAPKELVDKQRQLLAKGQSDLKKLDSKILELSSHKV